MTSATMAQRSFCLSSSDYEFNPQDTESDEHGYSTASLSSSRFSDNSAARSLCQHWCLHFTIDCSALFELYMFASSENSRCFTFTKRNVASHLRIQSIFPRRSRLLFSISSKRQNHWNHIFLVAKFVLTVEAFGKSDAKTTMFENISKKAWNSQDNLLRHPRNMHQKTPPSK